MCGEREYDTSIWENEPDVTFINELVKHMEMARNGQSPYYTFPIGYKRTNISHRTITLQALVNLMPIQDIVNYLRSVQSYSSLVTLNANVLYIDADKKMFRDIEDLVAPNLLDMLEEVRIKPDNMVLNLIKKGFAVRYEKELGGDLTSIL